MNKEFLDSVKEKYYLRDFDFFPEQIAFHPAWRRGGINPAFWEHVGTDFIIFDTREEALEACNKIRTMLGLKEYHPEKVYV